MSYHGFVRVAAAVPVLRVGDCAFNAGQMVGLIKQAEQQQVSVITFPELALTGYTCGDLFHQPVLQRGALAGLQTIADASSSFTGVVIVGLPLVVDDRIFNCAAVVHRGAILGVVPKSY